MTNLNSFAFGDGVCLHGATGTDSATCWAKDNLKIAVNLAFDLQQSKTTLQIHGRPLFNERVGDLKGPAGRYSRV